MSNAHSGTRVASGIVVHVLGSHEFDEYVGRSNTRHGLRGHTFQNPYRIGVHGTRKEVLEKFEKLVREYLLLLEDNRKELLDLRGKTLACWCAPKDGVLTVSGEPTEDETVCHGQILLRLADELAEDRKWEAFCRESDVRCIDCGLRYGERDQYGCVIEGHTHRYIEAELAEARKLEED